MDARLATATTIRRNSPERGDVTTAKTKADCHKAGAMWDAKTSACSTKRCKPTVALATLRRGVGFGRRIFCCKLFAFGTKLHESKSFSEGVTRRTMRKRLASNNKTQKLVAGTVQEIPQHHLPAATYEGGG